MIQMKPILSWNATEMKIDRNEATEEIEVDKFICRGDLMNEYTIFSYGIM